MSSSILVIHETATNVLEIVSPGPQGIPGADGTISISDFLIWNETPVGDIDSSNVDFSTAAEFTAIFVWLNGIRMNIDVDFTVTGDKMFQMTTAPTTGDTLIVDYVTI